MSTYLLIIFLIISLPFNIMSMDKVTQTSFKIGQEIVACTPISLAAVSEFLRMDKLDRVSEETIKDIIEKGQTFYRENPRFQEGPNRYMSCDRQLITKYNETYPQLSVTFPQIEGLYEGAYYGKNPPSPGENSVEGLVSVFDKYDRIGGVCTTTAGYSYSLGRVGAHYFFYDSHINCLGKNGSCFVVFQDRDSFVGYLKNRLKGVFGVFILVLEGEQQVAAIVPPSVVDVQPKVIKVAASKPVPMQALIKEEKAKSIAKQIAMDEKFAKELQANLDALGKGESPKKVVEKQLAEAPKKVANEKAARKKAIQEQIKKMEDTESWKFFPNRRFKGDRLVIIGKLVSPRGPQQGMAQDFMKRYKNLQAQLKTLG